MKTNKLIRGFSLTELLVAMAISLVLLLGVTKVMVSSKRAYYVQNDMGILLENARFGIGFLSNDLRMAGYFGCSDRTPPGIIPLAGRNDNGANSSDVIRVVFVEASQSAFSVVHTTSTTPLGSTQTAFPITTRGEIFAGDDVLVSDCVGSQVYTVASHVGYSTVTLTQGLDRTYNNDGLSFGAEMRRMVTRRYFIGTSNAGFSLFRDSGGINAALNTGAAEEVIQGIENMQIRYGEDTDADGVINQYLNSNEVTDMENVVAVRVSLLVNTMTERSDRDRDTATYDLGPATLSSYNPPDDYLRRQVFTTNVFLRN